MVEPAPRQNDSVGKLPILAIVGRPNVGKSTLFNRLVGERKAIVHDLPGVTRDRNYGAAKWSGKKFLLVDTGGLDSEAEGGLEERVQGQTRSAISEADVILFLLDGKGGLNPHRSTSHQAASQSQQAGIFRSQQTRYSQETRQPV